MILKVEHLEKRFPDGTTPIKDLNCEINEGDVISIIGPSGTGKSTFLNILNLLEEPTEGKIFYEGEDILAADYDRNAYRRQVGMVFQSFNLFSHLTIVENLMLAPVKLLDMPRQDAYDKAIDLLRLVGLKDKALSYPNELSGGQQQRAAIVRAMMMDPKVLLFDEPTSALDPAVTGEVLAVIKRLALNGMTMIIVTHELTFAKNISSRIFYMDGGLICEEGTPEQIFDNPANEKTREFINKLKVIRCHVDKENFDFPSFSSQIVEFAYKHMIKEETANRMGQLYEELCCRSIILKCAVFPEADISFAYSEEKGEIDMTMTWNGPLSDPIKDLDPLTSKIIMSAASEIRYSISDGLNRVDAKIKEK